MTDDVVALTADYEQWVGRHIPLVTADLAAKHAELAGPTVRFVRGTYYLWLNQMATALPELARGPLVPLVGDLHVENFGTWLDADGVRRWGVNDLDELAWGSYAIDLVRLATSAVLVAQIRLSADQICTTLLDHWTTADTGPALDLTSDSAQHLRPLVPKPASAKSFFNALRGSPARDDIPGAVRAAAVHSVGAGWQPSWFARRAGTGSLGHRRFVAVAPDSDGTEQAREVKELGPLTRDWPGARDPAGRADDALYGRVQTALRGPHAAQRVDGWQLRRLGPDVVRIDLSGLRQHDEERLLRSMAQACADVHGTDAKALPGARRHAASLGKNWLRDAVAEMTALTRAAHKTWRAAQD